MIDILKDELLPLIEVARMLKVGRHTIDTWRREKVLECIKFRKTWYTTKKALEAMARRSVPTEETQYTREGRQQKRKMSARDKRAAREAQERFGIKVNVRE